MADILVVDDDEAICAAFRDFLAEEGHTAHIASNAEDAIASVEKAVPDLVIMDIRMPGSDGLQALEQIRRIAPDVYVVIMTAYGTSQTSIEAVRLGAYEYLTKPLDLNTLRSVIGTALEARALARAARAAEPPSQEAPSSPINLVGKSAPMAEVYKLVGRLAANEVPALIIGERGVGKQLVAQTIHVHSRRKERPFVAVDCAAFPEAGLAEELFGRGGGSGAEVPGAVDMAGRGTLFLESVDALPLAVQARLVRLLAERTIERVGGRGGLPADVRVIAATDEDLADEVQQGNFNVGLFDALRVITIQLPPLRERREDIPELVAHFIKTCSGELGKTVTGVDARGLQLLTDHPWPGNVAELAYVIKRASILARGEVITADEIRDSLEDRPPPGREETDGALDVAVRKALQQRLAERPRGEAWPPFHDIVGRAEKVLVREALAMMSGNQVRAAQLLGLNRTTLRKKIHLYHLQS